MIQPDRSADRVKENHVQYSGAGIRTRRSLARLVGGTGQVGIEALSRGAREVIFLDTARAAIQAIHANLAATRLADNAAVLRMDAFDHLQQTKNCLM